VKLKNIKNIKKVIIGSSLILIFLAVIGFMFVIKDKPKINLAEKSTLAFPAKDTVSMPIQNNVEEIKPQLKEEKGIAEVKTEMISSVSKLTFDNGNYYEGKIKAGKMHGKGVFYFVNGGLISKDDPLERHADAGSYIEGEWFNGDLYKGRLFDKNKMMKEEIILGRN
jgi:copper chaperone CopZ